MLKIKLTIKANRGYLVRSWCNGDVNHLIDGNNGKLKTYGKICLTQKAWNYHWD